jgi:hypothetical protein
MLPRELQHGAGRMLSGENRIQEQCPFVSLQEVQEFQPGSCGFDDLHLVLKFAPQEPGGHESHRIVPQDIVAQPQQEGGRVAGTHRVSS